MQRLAIPTDIDAGLGPLVLAKWVAGQGQTAKAGQTVAILETPAAMIELQMPQEGVLHSLIAVPGQVLAAGQVVCQIGPAGSVVAAPDRPAAPPQLAPNASAVIPILMPQAGQTMEEGTILAWKVKEGDRIQAGQVILEIETDKAAMDVEATDSGRIARIMAKEGQVVPVKTPIAYLAERDQDVEAYLASQAGPAAPAQARPAEAPARPQPQVPTTAVVAQPAAGQVKASPAARKMAAEMGIDLTRIPVGSGPGGRILSTDLEGLKTGPKASGLSKMRLAIARNLLWSKQNTPHFYAKRTVDGQALLAAYRNWKQQFGCTINDIIVAACARAVREMPAFRSQFKDNAIVESPNVNIGIAVGTDDGLTVPVLLNADKLDLKTLSQNARRLVENARAGKLEAVGQGVFTVTNLGMFGVEEFYAIINPPESAILAVGSLREAIKVQQGNILPTHLMTLCLSVDHRVIDGVQAARFLERLAQLLERPEAIQG